MILARHRQEITDTRKIEQGDIFLAIQGDNFDGHDYVQTAKDKGAVLAIVSRAVESGLAATCSD